MRVDGHARRCDASGASSRTRARRVFGAKRVFGPAPTLFARFEADDTVLPIRPGVLAGDSASLAGVLPAILLAPAHGLRTVPRTLWHLFRAGS